MTWKLKVKKKLLALHFKIWEFIVQLDFPKNCPKLYRNDENGKKKCIIASIPMIYIDGLY